MATETATKYPECEKLHAVHETSNAIGDFLEWLGAQDIFLAERQLRVVCEWTSFQTVGGQFRYRCDEGRIINYMGEDSGECENCDGEGSVEAEDPSLVLRMERIEDMLARYFEIDMAKVDRERRAMLEEIRANA